MKKKKKIRRRIYRRGRIHLFVKGESVMRVESNHKWETHITTCRLSNTCIAKHRGNHKQNKIYIIQSSIRNQNISNIFFIDKEFSQTFYLSTNIEARILK